MKIATCSTSLLVPGVCCHDGCEQPATHAGLEESGRHLVEHAVCWTHAQAPDWLAMKRIRQWDPRWKGVAG